MSQRFMFAWVLMVSGASLTSCGPVVGTTHEAEDTTDEDLSGTYLLESVHSGDCADVKDSSKSNGAAVQQWSCTGTDNQQWHIHGLGSSTYNLISVRSRKCMDIVSAG